ncbi:hypothetical protein C3L33_18738, partial [Rhododendron williamsianum]
MWEKCNILGFRWNFASCCDMKVEYLGFLRDFASWENMSDGGGESGRDNNERSKTKNQSDDFARAISKIAVAQVCESVGFQIFQQSALNTLSDVAVRYIRDIGKTANNYSNLAGRAESNVFDIIQGLEDLGSWQGFSGASDIDRCLAGSGVVQEIIQYVGESEEIPFAYSIPEFPVVKDRNPNPSFGQAFLNSPSRNDRELDTQMVEIKHGKEQRKVEQSLLNLQQHLACNGSDIPIAFDPSDAAKAKQAAESNQFLAAPLRFGEKEVSSMELPPQVLNETAARSDELVQNHVSMLETCTPAIEAMESTLCDSEGGWVEVQTEEGREEVPLNTRATVQFKFGTRKKSLGPSINSWFGDDNERSDKKRRAEQILKESTEDSKNWLSCKLGLVLSCKDSRAKFGILYCCSLRMAKQGIYARVHSGTSYSRKSLHEPKKMADARQSAQMVRLVRNCMMDWSLGEDL